MKYIVDRIEGDYAVCEAEDRSIINIPISMLPSGIKEGDHIDLDGDIYTIIPTDNDRKNRIKRLMDNLWNLYS